MPREMLPLVAPLLFECNYTITVYTGTTEGDMLRLCWGEYYCSYCVNEITLISVPISFTSGALVSVLRSSFKVLQPGLNSALLTRTLGVTRIRS